MSYFSKNVAFNVAIWHCNFLYVGLIIRIENVEILWYNIPN